LAFGAMCVFWGLTWIAMKIGVTAVPPILFAGTRFLVAGLVLCAWSALREGRVLPASGDVPRLLATTALVIVATYSLLFWGVQYVSTGLAAIVNQAVMPLAMFLISVAHGEDRFSGRQALAVSMGLVGLVFLLGPKAMADGHGETLGLLAIVTAALVYAWGSVLSRPLLRRYSPVHIGALTMTLGGAVLVLLSLVVERPDRATFARLVEFDVLVAWAYLVVFGSLVGFTIFLRLVRDWGAARTGMFAFVVPIVAVLAGMVVFRERFGPGEMVGMAVLFAATWVALRRPPAAGDR